MGVSTSPEPAPAGAGVRRAAWLAGWLAPLLAPLALPKAALVAAPWLDSLEAHQQAELVVLASDARVREVLEALVQSGSGIAGVAAIGILLGGLWLLLVRRVLGFSLRRVAAAAGVRVTLALAALWCVAAVLLVAAGGRLGRTVDVATSVRPTSAWTLGLLLGTETLTLVAAGACAGAALAALMARGRARAGALAVLAATCATTLAAQSALRGAIAERCDVGISWPELAGVADEPSHLAVLALAPDRAWSLRVAARLGGVPLDGRRVALATTLLEERRGWTLLAPEAERLLIAERLVALDLAGARAAALSAVLRRGSIEAGHALLSSLAACSPDAGTRATLDVLEGSPRLHLGPSALRMLAQVEARHGDRAAAEVMLARLRSHGRHHAVAPVREALPLRIPETLDGTVSGRVLVDGQPWEGAIALVPPADVRVLERPDEPVPVTWLLRLSSVARCDADGRFRLDRVVAGDHALLVVERDPISALQLADAQALPDVRVGVARRAIDLGTIQLRRGGVPQRGPAAISAAGP